jgi:hypothetical protein
MLCVHLHNNVRKGAHFVPLFECAPNGTHGASQGRRLMQPRWRVQPGRGPRCPLRTALGAAPHNPPPNRGRSPHRRSSGSAPPLRAPPPPASRATPASRRTHPGGWSISPTSTTESVRSTNPVLSALISQPDPTSALISAQSCNARAKSGPKAASALMSRRSFLHALISWSGIKSYFIGSRRVPYTY